MLCPLQEGYGFIPGNNIREQESEGGMPRQVIAFAGAVHSVTVSVLLADPRTRQYFWAFWRQNLTKIWSWKLSLDNGVLEECECKFTSKSMPQESFRDGVAIKISFQVLVVPIERNKDHDEDIIKLWEMDVVKVYDDIEKVPNVWFPNATGV